LKLSYQKLLSTFAYNFNLRCYGLAGPDAQTALKEPFAKAGARLDQVLTSAADEFANVSERAKTKASEAGAYIECFFKA
jgi:hypothetical protein